ncbi:XdhC family protein [Notoacmeibacter sp. MSK16QG-6]|uniref:XdhC family protein n=1 Tax=Notoacmeibacter sp. MSK16QG-6 TaxID=2957982 RepID=UPI00209F9444|nr:XdhC/CoxI family protein [Notoacmeibacter sp. MSK16QG-6]MCP1200501.1 XdhC/CoxI family protein [Notoacmeibacter sp. MSK16QG-6]
MRQQSDIIKHAADLRGTGEAFVLATVVRTVAATAAKAGAKAIIRADGTIVEGWIGGGCARGAVLKAAKEAIADGQSRFISVQPEEALAEHGVAAGTEKEGVRFARNMCPSKGTMDVFVEPVLPAPDVVILGSSPVAVALANIAPRFGFHVTVCAPVDEQDAFAAADARVDGFMIDTAEPRERYVVVSTQGRGDEAALSAALSVPAAHLAFVGSKAKAASIGAKLRDKDVDKERLAALKAPAGLDIGAITPDEIALSILTEIVQVRRRRQRKTAEAAS